MPPDILTEYLGKVNTAVRNLADCYVERYEVEHLTASRVNLRIRIRFAEGYLLELNEAVFAEGKEIRHLGYRYHFQDKSNSLIFRYDNPPHFPDLEFFPNHKHSSSGVVAAKNHSIVQAIIEAAHIIKVWGTGT